MPNDHTLFTRVQDYYADLVIRLESAHQAISMVCLAFEDGQWSRRIANAMVARAAAGVKVRLMVDELGQLSDEPHHILSNHKILAEFRSAGVQVDIFQPKSKGLSIRNRMHCKFCAVDDETIYLGGSNIGDYYTTWSDTNLRVDGPLGDKLHVIYDYLRSFSFADPPLASQPYLSDLEIGDDRLLFIIPGKQLDIRHALLKLIKEADRSIHLRTWYFLPDAEILDALCTQAQNGILVNVLLSHRTRVRPVDLANSIPIHRLVCAGGRVCRYTGRYMHAKTTWNNLGTVLLGSANMDHSSMNNNFESCLLLQDQDLACQLQQAFEADLPTCILQTPESFHRQNLPVKFLSHACYLVSPWL